jgi:uncharacterized protein (DUF3084 family)
MLSAELEEREAAVAEREAAVAERETAVEEREAAVAVREEEIEAQEVTLAAERKKLTADLAASKTRIDEANKMADESMILAVQHSREKKALAEEASRWGMRKSCLSRDSDETLYC